MRAYLLCYDIRDQKRWRQVHQIAEGFGDPLQYSVFQCILSAERRVEMIERLRRVIHHKEDSVLVIDLGNHEAMERKTIRLGAQELGETPGSRVL